MYLSGLKKWYSESTISSKSNGQLMHRILSVYV